jgi:hypothetical protein
MSFQKQTTSAKKTQGYAPEEGGVLSLIDLAANLHNPIYLRAIGKVSIILKDLNSINATRTQQLRRSRALRRYVE